VLKCFNLTRNGRGETKWKCGQLITVLVFWHMLVPVTHLAGVVQHCTLLYSIHRSHLCLVFALALPGEVHWGSDRLHRKIKWLMHIQHCILHQYLLDASCLTNNFCCMCLNSQPKWGYLPSFDDVRGRVCRYCMHQFLKVKDGKWKLHSDYCPVDLFSGSVSLLLLPAVFCVSTCDQPFLCH